LFSDSEWVVVEASTDIIISMTLQLKRRCPYRHTGAVRVILLLILWIRRRIIESVTFVGQYVSLMEARREIFSLFRFGGSEAHGRLFGTPVSHNTFSI
jgi:hypothetical protein